MMRIALPLLFLASIAVAQTSPLAQYRAAASSLTDAKAAVQSAQSEFATCKNGRLQLAFATSLPRLEGARRNFEKSRKQAERARQDLEATRRRIEAARSAKHGSVAEREAAEARYATRLVEEYETPMATVAAANPPATARPSGAGGWAPAPLPGRWACCWRWARGTCCTGCCTELPWRA